MDFKKLALVIAKVMLDVWLDELPPVVRPQMRHLKGVFEMVAVLVALLMITAHRQWQ
jgi:hypothetical protein